MMIQKCRSLCVIRRPKKNYIPGPEAITCCHTPGRSTVSASPLSVAATGTAPVPRHKEITFSTERCPFLRCHQQLEQSVRSLSTYEMRLMTISLPRRLCQPLLAHFQQVEHKPRGCCDQADRPFSRPARSVMTGRSKMYRLRGVTNVPPALLLTGNGWADCVEIWHANCNWGVIGCSACSSCAWGIPLVHTCAPRSCISETARQIVFKFGVRVGGHEVCAFHKSWMGYLCTCARAHRASVSQQRLDRLCSNLVCELGVINYVPSTTHG